MMATARGPSTPWAGLSGCDRQAGDARQALNAFRAARRALVDGRVACGDGLRVGRAIGIAAARALGLGQCRVDAVKKRGFGGMSSPRLFSHRQAQLLPPSLRFRLRRRSLFRRQCRALVAAGGGASAGRRPLSPASASASPACGGRCRRGFDGHSTVLAWPAVTGCRCGRLCSRFGSGLAAGCRQWQRWLRFDFSRPVLAAFPATACCGADFLHGVLSRLGVCSDGRLCRLSGDLWALPCYLGWRV